MSRTANNGTCSSLSTYGHSILHLLFNRNKRHIFHYSLVNLSNTKVQYGTLLPRTASSQVLEKTAAVNVLSDLVSLNGHQLPPLLYKTARSKQFPVLLMICFGNDTRIKMRKIKFPYFLLYRHKNVFSRLLRSYFLNLLRTVICSSLDKCQRYLVQSCASSFS